MQALDRNDGDRPLKDNVIDLTQERTARAKRAQTDNQTHKPQAQQLECKDGVCVVNWRPQRPAA
jgi:hypothetical protein